MDENENLHAGHRERTIEKFLRSPELFSEHELLEILLFFSIPRCDTNEIAHRLLRTFKDLNGIFNASVQDLMSIRGVGKKVATDLAVIGKIFSKISLAKTEKKNYRSFACLKEMVIDFYKGAYEETFLILMLDKKYNEIHRYVCEDKSIDQVSLEAPEIANIISLYNPTYVIAVHNHPSGSVAPSNADDSATVKLMMLCAIHGMHFVDHVIVSGKQAYSYFKDGRLDALKKENTIFDTFN